MREPSKQENINTEDDKIFQCTSNKIKENSESLVSISPEIEDDLHFIGIKKSDEQIISVTSSQNISSNGVNKFCILNLTAGLKNEA